MTCFVTDPPPVIVPPQNVSVLPGDTAVLTCVAFSTVHYNMTWARMGSYGNLRLDPRMRWYNNGSLVIRQGAASVRFSYVCVYERESVWLKENFFQLYTTIASACSTSTFCHLELED